MLIKSHLQSFQAGRCIGVWWKVDFMSYVTGCIATFFGSLCRFTIFFTEIAIFKSLSAGGMPPVPQVAQQISQEEKQQQNGPNLSSLLNSLPAPHSRNPALPQQVQPAGWDKNHVLVVPAPVPSQQQVSHLYISLHGEHWPLSFVWRLCGWQKFLLQPGEKGENNSSSYCRWLCQAW